MLSDIHSTSNLTLEASHWPLAKGVHVLIICANYASQCAQQKKNNSMKFTYSIRCKILSLSKVPFWFRREKLPLESLMKPIFTSSHVSTVTQTTANI